MNKTTKKTVLGNAMLTTTAFIWGTAFVAQRVGMDHVEPFTFSAARYFLAALVLIPIIYFLDKRETSLAKAAGIWHEPTAEEKKRQRIGTLRGGCICGVILFVASSFQQVGLVYTTAGKAGFITALYIVLVPIFGAILFHKKVSWLTAVGVALATVGLYLLCIKEGFAIGKGDFLVFICAIFFSMHILACDHFTEHWNPVKLSLVQFTVSFVLAAITAFIVENPQLAGILTATFPIIYCGIFSAGVGYTLQMVAQKDTDPTIASLILSLEAVFGALGGYFILNEILSTKELIGCVIMFAAIIIAQIPLPEKQPVPEKLKA